MNLISLQQATMTSLDIADLVASRHDNVRVSIERLAERGVIQLPPMQEVENKQATSPNSKSKVYVFSGEQGKRDSIVVVAQLSPEFTARLVGRELWGKPQVHTKFRRPTPKHSAPTLMSLKLTRRPNRHSKLRNQKPNISIILFPETCW